MRGDQKDRREVVPGACLPSPPTPALPLKGGGSKPGTRRACQTLPLALLALALTGCPREDRNYGQPPFAEVTHFQAEYQDNAYALAEGKRLYYAFNCNGCHGDGGGGIGPPLMDEDWLYGAEPKQVFETIHDGRPNGMPPWGGKLPDKEIWRLVAYVRSLSGLARSDAAPGRWDHMQAAPPAADRERRPPRIAPAPDAGEHPK